MKKKSELRNIKFSKLYIYFGLFIFCLIIYRIGMLSTNEVVEGVNLSNFANSRLEKKEILYSKRGTIYDSNGNPLAENISSYTLIAYLSPSRTGSSKTPKHVVDKEMTASKLATVLDIPEEQILSYLNKDAYQVEFGPKAKNLTELKKDEIKALQLPGIDFIETQQRYYPYGRFASYVVGYARKKDVSEVNDDSAEDIYGEMGIEAFYNDTLTGTNGYTLYQKDRSGYKIPGTKEVVVSQEDGNDVYLTIDSNIQLFVEDGIEKISQECNPEFVSLILADAKTGAILASGTYPSFDPNVKDIPSYLNLNVSVPFEPGSTMKIYSFMAAMENGVYNGEETYRSGIFTAKDGTQIGDWKREGWGTITYDQGFALSSNTAIMNLINNYMDGDTLREYYKKLGFGSLTGIELPNEQAGKLNFKYETEVLNAGFGQALTTTPIQNVKALTAIANGGVLLKPYIVDKIVNPTTGQVIYEGKKQELDRVASVPTVEKIKELMRSVITGTSSTSTGYYYYMDGYDLIAKTGTAQVADPNGKGYSNEWVVRGLAGMFPGNDPRVIIYMAIKSKSCKTSALGEFVKNIVRNTSKYMEIYDETKEVEQKIAEYTFGSYINKDTSSVASVLMGDGIDYVIIGNGSKIIDQYPKSGEVVNKIDKVFLLTNGDQIALPNFEGYSYKDFNNYVRLSGINYTSTGFGYVVWQSIEPETIMDDSMTLEVTFETSE